MPVLSSSPCRKAMRACAVYITTAQSDIWRQSRRRRSGMRPSAGIGGADVQNLGVCDTFFAARGRPSTRTFAATLSRARDPVRGPAWDAQTQDYCRAGSPWSTRKNCKLLTLLATRTRPPTGRSAQKLTLFFGPLDGCVCKSLRRVWRGRCVSGGLRRETFAQTHA